MRGNKELAKGIYNYSNKFVAGIMQSRKKHAELKEEFGCDRDCCCDDCLAKKQGHLP